MDINSPVLPTTHGYVKGLKRQTVYGETYYSFEGIPYAKPPLGEMRFRGPQPPDAWADVLDCTNRGRKPLQKNQHTGELEGTEDCLYLNVYAKELHSDRPLPVLVYIYGGAFQNGDATRESLGPDYFMQENVILVTLNYRLGALGFLSLNDSQLKVPGNAGLKDQLAALSWCKLNCLNFNGDPQNITLFGESAGAASVHYLMLCDKAKGLFHKAIVMSGTVYNKWANIPRGDYAYRLAKLLGYTGENVDRLVLEHLMAVEGSSLMSHEVMTDEERLNGISFVFGPTVETCVSGDCIIPKSPHELIKSNWSNEIPMMIGGTSFEGLLRYQRVKDNPRVMEILAERPELILPLDVRECKTLEECQRLGREALQLYLGDGELRIENILKYLHIISHTIFWIGFQRSLQARLAYASTASTYLYRFDFDSPTFNLYRLKHCGPGVRGVAHADDLCYLFYSKKSWKLLPDSLEFKTIKRMVGMWTAFARHSKPNCLEIEPTLWTPVSEMQPNKCLNISTQVDMRELPEANKLAFWLNMYSRENLC